tara:strand:- start:9636 stop:9965 length:330 start_codon:yes stop_codon:yes gene_type:complete
MAVTWQVVQLERNSSDDGVVVAHWRVSDSSEVGNGDDAVLHHGSSYGTSSFSPNPESESWVEFVDITEELAIQWCKDSMGEEAVTSIESSIASQIEESKAPSVIAEVPW